MASMFSSQEIGFIAVMAVSGSVVLLALGRHRELLYGPKESKVKGFSQRSCLSAGRKCGRKKKVHFAQDVVEPRGDNEDYRRRHTLAMMRRLGSENENIYSDICTSKLQEGAGMDEDVSDSRQVSGTRGKRVRDCKIQREIKQPNIPANRLALYKGMLQYRSQTRASYY
eukprot:Gb_04731 [translate_table: standard]